MTKFTHVFTPLLICCYSIIGLLAIYQIYLMKRYMYNLVSFNTGFLCCCVPWCVLRIIYWLIPGNACAGDPSQLLQGFFLALPINLEFVCFYLIMIHIMRKVRLADPADLGRSSPDASDAREKFKRMLLWVSLVGHITFLACNVFTVIFSVTAGTRSPYSEDPSSDFQSDNDCVESAAEHLSQCQQNGCFAANNLAGNLQLGLTSIANLLLALCLMYYGVKLHISDSESKANHAMARQLASSIVDATASIPQIAFGAGESPLVTEGVCVALLLVFVSRAFFDALQLDIFAASPLSIPQDKDVTQFWIFFVYMAWEICPISLMLFFFGRTKHASKPTGGMIERLHSHSQRLDASARDEEEVPEPSMHVPDAFWPMALPSSRSRDVSNQSKVEHVSIMDNESRYDSQPGTPQQQPMQGPSGQLQPNPMHGARPGQYTRSELFRAAQWGAR